MKSKIWLASLCIFCLIGCSSSAPNEKVDAQNQANREQADRDADGARTGQTAPPTGN